MTVKPTRARRGCTTGREAPVRAAKAIRAGRSGQLEEGVRRLESHGLSGAAITVLRATPRTGPFAEQGAAGVKSILAGLDQATGTSRAKLCEALDDALVNIRTDGGAADFAAQVAQWCGLREGTEAWAGLQDVSEALWKQYWARRGKRPPADTHPFITAR